jgi:predicted ATP-dependent serine protease
MKALSIIEVSLTDNSKDVKCRSCSNWNSFDAENNQTLNVKRKSQDVLYGYERNVIQFKSGGKLKK